MIKNFPIAPLILLPLIFAACATNHDLRQVPEDRCLFGSFKERDRTIFYATSVSSSEEAKKAALAILCGQIDGVSFHATTTTHSTMKEKSGMLQVQASGSSVSSQATAIVGLPIHFEATRSGQSFVAVLKVETQELERYRDFKIAREAFGLPYTAAGLEEFGRKVLVVRFPNEDSPLKVQRIILREFDVRTAVVSGQDLLILCGGRTGTEEIAIFTAALGYHVTKRSNVLEIKEINDQAVTEYAARQLDRHRILIQGDEDRKDLLALLNDYALIPCADLSTRPRYAIQISTLVAQKKMAICFSGKLELIDRKSATTLTNVNFPQTAYIGNLESASEQAFRDQRMIVDHELSKFFARTN
jgi:hypothetical protein